MRRVLYQRRLRTTEQIALKGYTCDHCHNPIFPGDIYEAEISALRVLIAEGLVFRKVKMISTYRMHVSPCCGDPDDFDEEMDRIEREKESELSSRVA